MTIHSTLHIPIVGVMGSGRDEYAVLAEPLGRWLASLGVHLLTGGGGGVMSAVSRAFARVRPRCGNVLGILPGHGDPPAAPPGYPNEWVEVAIRTHLPFSGEQGTDPLSRNHINVLTSDILIALPGGAGTRTEVELAVRYGKPLIAFGWDPGIEGSGVCVARSLDGVEEFVIERLGEAALG